jgi:hypothetical protein
MDQYGNCALLGYYLASSGDSLRTFQDNLSIASSEVKFLTPEEGTARLSRNVGNKLPLLSE